MQESFKSNHEKATTRTQVQVMPVNTAKPFNFNKKCELKTILLLKYAYKIQTNKIVHGSDKKHSNTHDIIK